MFGLSGVRHLAAPPDNLTSGHDHGVSINPEILNLQIMGSDYEKSRIDHSQELLLGYELVQRICHDKIVGP